jgi:hypothetical protein
MFNRLFLDHPRALGESWLAHSRNAAGFGVALARASAACFVHALVPGLCRTTGSRAIVALHTRMVTHRGPPPAAGSPAEFVWMSADI